MPTTAAQKKSSHRFGKSSGPDTPSVDRASALLPQPPHQSEMPVTYKDMYLTLMGRLIQLRTLLEASDPEMYQEVVDGWLEEHIKF